MIIKTVSVGLLQTNCYIAYGEKTHEGIIIDPGADADAILRAAEGVRIKYILLTHGHFDHTLALASLKNALGAQVAVHKLDAPCLSDPDASLFSSFFRNGRFSPVSADILLSDGDVISADDISLTVVHTPGHTQGCVCFDDGVNLFTGDTLFRDGCGRCDFPGGSYSVILSSLQRLASLHGDRNVFPGHGVSTTLEAERRGNTHMLEALS